MTISSSITKTIIAVVTVVFSFSLFGVLLFREIDTSVRDIIMYILGAVTSLLTTIVSYYFGSSNSSSSKDQTIKDLKGMTKEDNKPVDIL